jgi:hypothetical protein
MGDSSQNENFILIEENETNENEMNIEKYLERKWKMWKQKIAKLKKMGKK